MERLGIIKMNWTHHSPSGINKDSAPAIIVIVESPITQIMLKCKRGSSFFEDPFSKVIVSIPHVQQRNVTYNQAVRVTNIITF